MSGTQPSSARRAVRPRSLAAWLTDRAAEVGCDCPPEEAEAYVDFIIPVAPGGDAWAIRLLPELVDHALRRGGLLP